MTLGQFLAGILFLIVGAAAILVGLFLLGTAIQAVVWLYKALLRFLRWLGFMIAHAIAMPFVLAYMLLAWLVQGLIWCLIWPFKRFAGYTRLIIAENTSPTPPLKKTPTTSLPIIKPTRDLIISNPQFVSPIITLPAVLPSPPLPQNHSAKVWQGPVPRQEIDLLAAVSNLRVPITPKPILNKEEKAIYTMAKRTVAGFRLNGWQVYPQVSMGELFRTHGEDRYARKWALKAFNSKQESS